jgi:Ser/Thr protein kinase RdoA (MazF antagonist)
MTDQEIPLKGGRVTAGVVRVGDTVRRPLGAHSPFVHKVLRHLETRGLEGVPRVVGVDAKGREILSFLPGEVPNELGNFSEVQLTAAARLLRKLHDAAADCDLKGNCETICHGDPGPCNTVFVDGIPAGMIDFDAMRPGFRREDVGYAAWLWLSIGDERYSPELQGERLAAFTKAYDAIELKDVVPALLAVQDELGMRPGVPANVRKWARSCRRWVAGHLSAINRGMRRNT